jgi:hypothetical protein
MTKGPQKMPMRKPLMCFMSSEGFFNFSELVPNTLNHNKVSVICDFFCVYEKYLTDEKCGHLSKNRMNFKHSIFDIGIRFGKQSP